MYVFHFKDIETDCKEHTFSRSKEVSNFLQDDIIKDGEKCFFVLIKHISKDVLITSSVFSLEHFVMFGSKIIVGEYTILKFKTKKEAIESLLMLS